MKKLKLLFIGESPSAADPLQVLENCQSGKRLDDWIKEVGARDVYTISKLNAFHSAKIPEEADYREAAKRLQKSICSADVVVALGVRAGKVVSKVRGDYISFMHPSGRNRKLNDSNFVVTQLTNLAFQLRERYYMISEGRQFYES